MGSPATIGSYELEDELGHGGMGRVYRARHLPTGAVRALKLLLGGADPEAVVRFRREAEALAKVGGRGVVPIHDLGVERGQIYLVMALLAGGSLRARLRREGKLPWRVAASLVAKLARTLDRCHAAGVIHRDVKPDNVLLDEASEPWLADFGLVRDLGASKLTETGTSLGTLPYMSPEQLEGLPADARTDVYALGVLLYEAVAGSRPWGGQTVAAHMRSRAETRPKIASPAPGDLERVLDRALAFAPDRRTPSAGALADDLEALVSGRALGKPGAGRTLALLGWGVVASLGLLGAAVVVRSRAPTPAPTPAVGSPSPEPRVSPEDPALRHALERERAGDTALLAGQLTEAQRAFSEALPEKRDGARRKLLLARALLNVPPGAAIELAKSLLPERSENAALKPFAPLVYRRGVATSNERTRFALYDAAWKLDEPREGAPALAAEWRAYATRGADADTKAFVRLSELRDDELERLGWRIAWGWRAQLIAPTQGPEANWKNMGDLRQLLVRGETSRRHRMAVRRMRALGVPFEHPTLCLIEANSFRDDDQFQSAIEANFRGMHALPELATGEDPEIGALARAFVVEICEIGGFAMTASLASELERAARHDQTGEACGFAGGTWLRLSPKQSDRARECLAFAKSRPSFAVSEAVFNLEVQLLEDSGDTEGAVRVAREGFGHRPSLSTEHTLLKALAKGHRWSECFDPTGLELPYVPDESEARTELAQTCRQFQLEALWRLDKKAEARKLAVRFHLEAALAELVKEGER